MSAPVKHDAGKPAVDLLLGPGGIEIAKALTFGAAKYRDRFNYARGEGLAFSRLAGALGRHIAEWLGGSDRDAETGLHPLAHAGACVHMLLNLIAWRRGIDDRFQPGDPGVTLRIPATPESEAPPLSAEPKCATCDAVLAEPDSLESGSCWMCRVGQGRCP